MIDVNLDFMKASSSFSSHHSPLPQKKRFTLIELLVVIAIIAILAAMLLPALSTAKNSGRTMQCLNNRKSLTIVFQQYLADYNAFPTLNTGWTWLQRKTIPRPAYPSLMVYEKWIPPHLVDCDMVPKDNQYTYDQYAHEWTGGRSRVGVNSGLTNWTGSPAPGHFIITPVVKVKHPSRIPLLAEARWDNYSSVNTTTWMTNGSALFRYDGCGMFAFRHDNFTSCPLTFVDGHAMIWKRPAPVVSRTILTQAMDQDFPKDNFGSIGSITITQ